VLLIILMCFGAGFSQNRQKYRLKIPTVNFCELITKSDKYTNKVVRVEASYIGWWESSYLYSEKCIDDEHKIQNATDCDKNDGKCYDLFATEWKKLEPFMRSKKSEFQTTFRVKAIFIGRLNEPGTYGHLGSFKYQFRIQKIEKAIIISKNVSWEGL